MADAVSFHNMICMFINHNQEYWQYILLMIIIRVRTVIIYGYLLTGVNIGSSCSMKPYVR